MKQLTRARFGAATPSMTKDGKLLFADYTAAGYKISRLAVDETSGTDTKFDSPAKFAVAETLSAQESFNIDTLRYPAFSPYRDKPYPRGLHLFNVHSWAPFYTNFDYVSGTSIFTNQDIYPGVMLMSQNRLNTMITELAYYYDYNELSNHGVVSMRYQGWFPVLQLRVDVGGDKMSLTGYDQDIPDYLHETRVELDFSSYCTMDFTNNHYRHGLQPFVGYYYTNNMLIAPPGARSTREDFQHLHGGIYYYRYRQLAHRDIFPRWGWQLWARYLGHPFMEMGQLFFGKMNIYTPGFVRNHGVKLSAAYQHQYILSGQFFVPRRIIDVPRGCEYYPANYDMMTGTADYSFGLAYPDAALGSIIYLARIRANLFGDYARSHVLRESADRQLYYAWENLYSYGLEMYFDMFFFRLRYAPVSLKLGAMNANGSLRGNISVVIEY